MKELKNSFHTELAIGILISDEETLDAKLTLLTEIGLTASGQETFKICEKFRDRLCSEENQERIPTKGRRREIREHIKERNDVNSRECSERQE